MPGKPQDDPVLKRFRAAVAEIYGERVERVVLYGSRARGDARADSDYDIAVFLHDMNGIDARMAELNRLAEIQTDILKARAFLDQAETMLHVNLIEAAGRTAYLAAFHAAQAFIFETTGRIYKRHSTYAEADLWIDCLTLCHNG